ncbi:MAG TPA: glycosyltransferase family 39 protein [Acidimicrobiales bacterium]|nr:glycosyltransferase family 39 protein [Acidimicrobiales bacterium]
MTVRTASPAVGSPAPSRRPAAAWWLLPPLVVAVLGGWLIAHRYGFWYDELYTAEVAPVGLSRLLDAFVRGEGTIAYLRDAPPSYNFPYYVVAHLWLALTPFGPDELGLRVLSLVAMVAAVAVFTRAVARLADRRTGLVAGLLVATNPFVVAYAGEARGYALALLATSVAALGLARWLDGEPGALALFVVGSAFAGLFHWYAVLVSAAFAVAAVILRRRDAGPVAGWAGIAALPALAVVATALANGVGGSGAEWIRGVGPAVPRLVLRSWAGGSLVLALAVLAAVVAGALRGDRRPRVVAMCWVVLPVAAVTAGELVRPVYVDRYLLPAVIGLAVLAALGVGRCPRRWQTVALAGLLVPSVAVTAGNVTRGPREDVRGAVAVVAAGHRPGDPVVAAARWDALGVEHYARRHHPELIADLVLPPAPVPPAPTVWVVRRAAGGVKGDLARLADLDRELAGRGLRVAGEDRLEGRRSVVLVQRWAG